MAVGLAIAAMGLVGIVAPSVLIELARSIQTPLGLYIVSAVRVLFGLILLFAASTSRMPKTLRMIGIVIILAGLVGMFVGAERFQAIANWAVSRPAWFLRVVAVLPFLLGVFIAYVVAAPRRHFR